MMTVKRRILAGFMLLMAVPFSYAAQEVVDGEIDSTPTADGWKYVPNFHGVLRTFYEWSTATGQSKFMVRNARLSAGGYILPKVDYFLQVDLCDRGKISILDAYARISPVDGLQLYAGQMRVPFSVESSRKPSDYHFADVGLLVNLGNLRSVGVKAGYTIPKTTLYFEGGIFNGSDKISHVEWNSQLTYSIKANYYKAGFKPEIAFQSRVKGGADGTPRYNQTDVALSWSDSKWFIEGEYIFRKYSDATPSRHAYDFFVDYGWPVKWKFANRLSVQARYDGITDNSYIKPCRRLTLGTTAHYAYKSLFLNFRLNYEQYFYDDDVTDISPTYNNKLVAGLILSF